MKQLNFSSAPVGNAELVSYAFGSTTLALNSFILQAVVCEATAALPAYHGIVSPSSLSSNNDFCARNECLAEMKQ